MKVALLIPDTHRPYHDSKAYNLMIKVAKDISLDEIVILGDYADIYALNAHGGKSPVLPTTLIEEIEDVNDGLDELDLLFPKAKKVFIQGNHEYRFERYILNNCPELFGITEFKNLINIDKRTNWKFIHYGPNQAYSILGSKLTARHEPLASSAKATASKALCSLIYGHIHRIEESHLVGLDGTNHVCFSVGWLGDKSLDKIYGYVKGHHQWQLGFGLVYVDEKTGYFYHQKIHILDNYTCVVNGKLYK
jgi:UDP-2,3-diacylglucosamine pyrophosphatase LpxH